MAHRSVGGRWRWSLAILAGISHTTCKGHERATTPSLAARPTPRAPVADRYALDEHLTEPVPTAARVLRASAASELCAGPNAVGKIGDWVLDNGVVRAVVDDVRTGGGGFSLSGGQLVDVQRVDGSRRAPDELGQVFNFLGRFPRQLRYTSATSEVRPNGSAAVIVRGEDPRTPGLTGETRYILAPGRCAIELETTLAYAGTSPTEVGLGDAIQWAGAEHWAPGVGHALRGERRGPWIAGVGRETVYAIVAEDSAELFGPNGSAWSNPMQRTITLAAGQSVTYKRAIGVSFASGVGDALRCAGFRGQGTRMQGRVRVRDAQGRPFAGARVVLEDAQGAPRWMAASGTDGLALVESTAAGTFTVRVTAMARGVTVASGGSLVLGAPGATESPMIDATVGAASALRVSVEDGAPTDARVLIYGENGTPDPMLGAIGRGDGARNSVLVSHRGQTTVPIAPGSYRLVATKGGFYTLGEARVTVVEGATQSVSLSVRRVIDAEHRWVCGDFHTHQAPSLDSPVSTRDRVLAAAAEGLDVVAATDHNVATDLSAAASAEDLDQRLVTMGGDEVSTDIAVNPTGHWNIYPLRVDPSQPLNGAPDLFEVPADELVARMRRQHPDTVIQVNHPRAGSPTGLFDIVALDPRTGRAARPGFSPTFDAIEVWNGRYQPQADGVVRDWFSLLRNGARITGVANSDSHAIVTQEVGYPRTCFRGSHTWRSAGGPPGPTADEQARAMIRQKRDVVMTDGPILEVLRADRSSAVGELERPVAPGETLTVRAVSVGWAPADTLERVDANGTITALTGARVTRDGDVVRVEASWRASAAAQDSIVLFRVRGTQPIPVLVGDPPMVAMAMSNPVYVRGSRGRPRRSP
ncbi:MAG: CehA/McbA family metallohydrolase [Myxococcales bacterium]|nr:CehA/McbA family metallohydrolase [Myxococcales bacterium]